MTHPTTDVSAGRRGARRLPASAACAAHWLGRGAQVAGAALALCWTGCTGGGGGGSGLGVANNPRLMQVHFGRIVDVYGLRATPAGTTVELFASDILIGPDILDERPSNSTKADEEIQFDFLNADPDTLQPRLLITRTISSPEFRELFDKLDDQARLVQPGVFGQNTTAQPFSVVGRDAGLRLTFSHNLGVTEDFFVERGPNGEIAGIKNAEAVQLLEITGDPAVRGNVRQIPVRVLPSGNQLLLDPVLLGTEGLQYRVRNSASGMPESGNQTTANMRIALALEGPLAIPGLRPDQTGSLTGLNLSGAPSIIRDFRSGNRNDNTPDISQGFLRDALPPRIAGQIVMYVERVDPIDDLSQLVTVYKDGAAHEIDRGDVLRLIVDNSGVPAAVSEVVSDPVDDLGQPSVQHVRVVVRRVVQTDPATGAPFDVFEAWDPSEPPSAGNAFWRNNPGIPPYPAAQQPREAWLKEFAPRGVLVAEFTAERLNALGEPYGDDPRFFVNFTPAPLGPNGEPSPPNENISPFAGAVVRFTKPVDLSTVKALDTYFFGTRNLLDPAAVAEFQAEQGIDPKTFVHAKFVTPHLVAAQVFDEDGSQTALRLQPTLGFYLDEQMRQADEGKPFEEKQFRYYLHLLGGKDGIKDLSGNQLDFQAQVSVVDKVVIPFSLNTGRTPAGEPIFGDNRVVTVARRFANVDEDEQPSYYEPEEVQGPGQPFNADAFNLEDTVGAVVYLTDGGLTARPTSRVRQVVDDLNQPSAPPQELSPEEPNPARHCPSVVGSEPQIPAATAGARFGNPLQNPLNPFGCRLQMVWREIDMNLSKTDASDFNLDVEQLYWAPFTEDPITYDEFDQMSLFLGHCEFRPENCVGQFSALPTLANSGLGRDFADNYVFNPALAGGKENEIQPYAAFVDETLTVLANQAIKEPHDVYRYLPLPKFESPYFVWRDERVMLQGAESSLGFDTATSRGNNYEPYILSPFLTGRGRYVTSAGGGPKFNPGYWDSRNNHLIQSTTRLDTATGGLVGSIGLPLLADFWVHPDDPTRPAENPFRASGINGWQISVTVQSAPTPNFRVYSAGGLVGGQPRTVSPGSAEWAQASGGYDPSGAQTRHGDNTLFWVMADFLKRISVMTAGFVDIYNPHRVTPRAGSMVWPPADPRLGPYFDPQQPVPSNVMPNFGTVFEPPLNQLPGGTSITAEYRGAGEVDPNAWAAAPAQGGFTPRPDPVNFPLDPRKAGDAHIRKFDDRPVGGAARNYWTYYYNRHVTSYTEDPNQLMDESFTRQFAGRNESFRPQDVRYLNWRFVFENNVAANPPITPRLESFILTYRFETR